jgi:hypothetical protein
VPRTHDVAAHRFLLSIGAYDDMLTATSIEEHEARYLPNSPLLRLMLRSVEHFETLRTRYWPNLYEMPNWVRVLLAFQCTNYLTTDLKVVPLFFNPTGALRAEDLFFHPLTNMSALFFPAHGWFEAAWDLAFCSIGFGRFSLDYATFFWERQRHGIAAVASTMTISQLVHQGSGNNITSPTILVRGLWNLSNIRDIHIGLRWKNSRCATCRDSAGQGTENEAAGSHHKGD